jgi:hypothetical protein
MGVPVTYHALLRGKPGADVITHTHFDLGADDSAARIRCPQCEWKPPPSSKWYCGPCPEPEGKLTGCGAAWNTFSTRGLCPGCQHRWRWTSCHACGEWSLHDDWYVADDEGRKPA